MAQSVYVDTASCTAVGFGCLVESQEGLETEVGSRADLMPYSAAVDLVAGLGASQVVSDQSRFYTWFETLDFRQAIRINCLNFKLSHMIYSLVLTLRFCFVEEDPSEPTPDSKMMPEPERDTGNHWGYGYLCNKWSMTEAASQQVVALREEISRMDALFYAACQARQFIAQFLGTTRDSVDRARDELESRPGCSGSQCPQAE
ncbi:hypothetical protein M9H77_22349 [Catharanthus roseus]|uniref:Uncharacterized protein n=1 Tax=Catharanthus roseus TaxID=4058 RepID=A0ACC0AQN4_CATRO|nr:hypothetical protein M9H77_22349 [Catharanthus roseus]